ncbi:MAG TPA: C4-dicarboxylate ABC transporter substrate-binding protein [Myxococcales bacterium]|nr:C4-dicarboxylate ABC transporter substrate-binding protein [Myxococcales bacterium]HBU46852.1 C4-dicarboxylate ABC transporter substrate-binding protein [Myxococcales bacterium]
MRRLAVVFSVGLFLASGPVAYAKAKKLSVRAGSVAPQGTPWAIWLKQFAKRIGKQAKEAGMNVRIKPALGGKLGGEKEMVEECRLGRLPLIGVSTGAIATAAPSLNVFELPYLFQDSAEADYVLDNVVFDRVSEILARQGFVLLGFSENGWHGMATLQKPIQRADDFKGLKLRVQQSRVHLETFRALGGSPVEMGVPEVLSALQNKVVDGFTNTPLFTFATNWVDSIKHYSLTGHIYQPAVLVASKKWFDRQDKRLQKILMDPKYREKETNKGRQLIRKLNEPLLQQFKLKKVKVHKVSPAERKEMAKRAKKVHTLFKSFGGPEGAKLLAAIEKGLKAYRKGK